MTNRVSVFPVARLNRVTVAVTKGAVKIASVTTTCTGRRATTPSSIRWCAIVSVAGESGVFIKIDNRKRLLAFVLYNHGENPIDRGKGFHEKHLGPNNSKPFIESFEEANHKIIFVICLGFAGTWRHWAEVVKLLPHGFERDANSCISFHTPLNEMREEPFCYTYPSMRTKNKGRKNTKKRLHRSTESVSINSRRPLGDGIGSREKINVPLDIMIEVSNNMDSTKGQLNLTNQAGTNAEAEVQCNTNIEADDISQKSESNEVEANNVSTKTRPSEETVMVLHILRDFASKKFSLLLHPGRSILMKDVLKHLMSLPPDDEGLSLRTKLVIHRLSTNFAKWEMEYDNASPKLESAAAEQTKVEKLNEELEANHKGFKEVETKEKSLCTKLASLEEKKRELEEQINVVKAEIVDFTTHRDRFGKRKREVFENGKMLKGERDDLMKQVARLKADQELAKVTLANIEADWSWFGE